MAKRVTIVSRVFRPDPVAVAIQSGKIFEILQEKNFEVQVLTSRSISVDSPKQKNVKRWPVLRDKQGAVRGYLQYLSFDIPLFFRLLFGSKLGTILVTPPPTTGFMVRIASAIRGKKYIYFADDLLSSAVAKSGTNRLIAKFVRFLDKFSMRGAKVILTISPEVKTEILKLIGNKKDIRIVGTGIDTSCFNLSGETEKPAEQYLLYSGTFSEIHGASVFIDAFEQVTKEFPKVKMFFYGQGTESDSLRKVVDEKDLQVEFHDLVPAERIAMIMRGAIAGLASVRPNKGYDFAYATKAFAMLACGLPVIYAGVGPVREIISEHGLGLVSDWNVEKVAESLKTILMQQITKAERLRISEFAISNFSYDSVASKVEQVLTEIDS